MTDMAACDVVVVGSGVGGLAAAVVARRHGLETLIVEKAAYYGGVSAISGGAAWLPGNTQGKAHGHEDSVDLVTTYLDREVGNRSDRLLRQAFVEHAAEALAYLEQHSALQVAARPWSPDYHPEVDGGSEGGRVVEVAEYDARALGANFANLRPPPDGFLLFRGMMVNRADIAHFLKLWRSFASFTHCARLLARYALDRLRFPRGTRLVVGNALVGQLAQTVFDLDVPLWLDSPAEEILIEDGRVAGLRVARSGEAVVVEVRKGVVLATGGFGADAALAASRRPGAHDTPHDTPHGAPHVTMAYDEHTGDGLRLGAAAGGSLGDGNKNDFFWAPVSVWNRADGRRERFPHLVTDRAKPGIIAVNRAGRRFVNEANSYHDFVEAMFESRDGVANRPAYLICDKRALDAYGMGLARPKPGSIQALLDDGYLVTAPDLAGLAGRLDLPADSLAETVARFNKQASAGTDPEFGRGSTSYNRYMGDPDHAPCPCLGPLIIPPFYAVEVFTGDIGTVRGLRTDVHARVIDDDGAPVPGLYAVGNDMNSIMGGTYPAPGIVLGPALTFAYLAARHLAGEVG